MRVVEAVVQRLLMVAVADINALVRKTVLQIFKDTTALDIYLAQADWCALCHTQSQHPAWNPCSALHFAWSCVCDTHACRLQPPATLCGAER